MQRTRATRLHNATEWVLAKVGLQRYEDDGTQGLRHWGHDESDDWNHNQREEPSFPLLGHSNVLWMFRKSSDVNSDSWDITEVGTGTQLALQDELGGVARFINGALDNNFQYYRSKAELFQIPSAGVLTFRTKIRIADVDQCDMFVGYCERVTGAAIFDTRVNALGWYLTAGGGGRLYCENRVISVAKYTGPTEDLDGMAIPVLVDNEWIELAFSVQINPVAPRTGINFFKNGQFMVCHTTEIPAAAMAFTFALRNGQAVANEFSIGTTVQLNS